MRGNQLRALAALVFSLFFLACEGEPSVETACQPGDTRACIGVGACDGGQICLEDGVGFGECLCDVEEAADSKGKADDSSNDDEADSSKEEDGESEEKPQEEDKSDDSADKNGEGEDPDSSMGGAGSDDSGWDVDSDGDGFSDLEEVACGSEPGDGSKDPLDSDGDGICDRLDDDDDGDGVSDANDPDPLDPADSINLPPTVLSEGPTSCTPGGAISLDIDFTDPNPSQTHFELRIVSQTCGDFHTEGTALIGSCIKKRICRVVFAVSDRIQSTLSTLDFIPSNLRFVAPEGRGDSSATSWENASAELAEAAEEAASLPDGEVWVARGVHTVRRQVNLIAGQALSVVGGFTIGDSSAAEAVQEPSITVLDAETLTRHFYIKNASLSLNNISIVRGKDGAIDASVSQIEIIDSVFENNTGSYEGGAISARGYEVTGVIKNTRFSNNRAEREGGAISGGTWAIGGSYFDQNGAESGGAISTYESIAVTDTIFTGNTTSATGGALRVRDGIIEQCSFWENYSRNGGAIYTDANSLLTVRGSFFSGNSATSGADFYSSGPAQIVNSVFVGGGGESALHLRDEAELQGVQVSGLNGVGVVVNTTETLSIRDSMFSECDDGALEITANSQVAIVHSTFVDNEGFGALSAGDNPVDLLNSIFIGNGDVPVTGSAVTEVGLCGQLGTMEAEPVVRVLSGEYFLRDSGANACFGAADQVAAGLAYADPSALSVFSHGGLDEGSADPGVHYDPTATWITAYTWPLGGTLSWEVHNAADCYVAQWRPRAPVFGAPQIAAPAGGSIEFSVLDETLFKGGFPLVRILCNDPARVSLVRAEQLRQQ